LTVTLHVEWQVYPKFHLSFLVQSAINRGQSRIILGGDNLDWAAINGLAAKDAGE